MRNHYIILILFFAATHCFSQSSNRLYITGGLAANTLVRSPELDGAGGDTGNGVRMIGLRYIRAIKNKLAFETGLEYALYKYSITPAFHPGIDMSGRKENVELISVPIFLNYTFGKYFFVNGGVLADFQINNKNRSTIDRQSGMGLGIGIGGKIDLKRITIMVNPYIQQHAIIASYKERYQQRILEAGVRIGVGYLF